MSKRQEIFFSQIGIICDIVVLLTSYAAAYGVRIYALDLRYGALFPFASYLIFPVPDSGIQAYAVEGRLPHS